MQWRAHLRYFRILLDETRKGDRGGGARVLTDGDLAEKWRCRVAVTTVNLQHIDPLLCGKGMGGGVSYALTGASIAQSAREADGPLGSTRVTHPKLGSVPKLQAEKVVLLRPTTTSYYYVLLLRPTTSYYYVLLLRPTTTYYYYVLLLRPTTTSYYYVLLLRPNTTSYYYALLLRTTTTYYTHRPKA